MTGPTTLSATLFQRLRREILDGTLAAGEALPGERALADAHGLNRHAVREAVKRLQQSGLVEVAQGGATRIRDWRRTGGLDLLTTLATDGDPATAASVLPAILEMRATIGVDVAGRAAERADDATLTALGPALAAVTAADPAELGAREEAYADLWGLLVDASANLAYRLAFNSLVDGVAAIGLPALELLARELADDAGHAALVDAVARRDAPAAELAARALLTTVPGDHA